jgi:hypothetical protein
LTLLTVSKIQQLDFVAERKRWEADKARQAPPEDDNVDEDVLEDMDLPEILTTTQSDQAMSEVDYIAAQEEYELQQLITSMEQESDLHSQHYGSDDEDYDSIFMECAASFESKAQQSQHAGLDFEQAESMDMDMTDG